MQKDKFMSDISRKLRYNMTKEEKHLWYDFLKNLPINVYRQKQLKDYIVDFCIPSKMIVIEIDGSQHYEEEHMKKDKIRDEALNGMGFQVLRYTNADINLRFDYVCNDILNAIK